MAARTERIDLRVTREDMRLIEKAALVTGQSVTSLVLSSALDRAREALDRETRTVLSGRDGRAFLRLLEEAGAPSAALSHAVAHSHQHG